MKDILQRLSRKEELGQSEIDEMISGIGEDLFSREQVAGFLMGLLMKGPTVGEVAAIARAMHRVCVPINLPYRDQLTDTCGTGGGLTTFNVSSANAILSAAAGVMIAKHGSRSISASSGSACVLESLGIEVELLPSQAEALIKEVGFAFFYAPLFHPVMMKVLPPENELGIKTIFFTIIGPLINPAGARRHVLGVYRPELVDQVAQVVAELDYEHVMVVHGLDGLDEISMLGETRIAEVKRGKINNYTIAPEDFGMERCCLEDVRGGSPPYNAEVILELFKGKERGPKRDMLLLNAAATMVVSGKTSSLEEGLHMAETVLESGAALNRLNMIRDKSRALKGAVKSGSGQVYSFS